MKRISIVLTVIIGSIGFLFFTPAASFSGFSGFSNGNATVNESLIVVSGPTHREMSGKFLDDTLIEDLSFGGKLAEVLKPSVKSRTWLIDPSVIEEIIDMSDGYTVLPKVKGAGEEIAAQFLVDLKYAIGDDPVYALPYGSPKISTRKKFSDVEFSQLQSVSSVRLARALGRAVTAGAPPNWNETPQKLSSMNIAEFRTLRKQLALISQVSNDLVISETAIRLTTLLNPELDKKSSQYLAVSFTGAVNRLAEKLRVLPGRYTLTSREEKLPVTIVNDFDAPAQVVLTLKANNSRILSIEDRALYLQPNSRTQVLVPVKAIASGKVELQAQLETLRGTKYQGISTLAVTIAVIGPIVGWVMAIAGILLIGAAGTRIFRRVRKARATGATGNGSGDK
jgi:hypothetical protein